MEAQKLLVTVVTARDIPDKERSGVDSWQVHVVLLPGKKQRHKTGVQRGSTPCFSETFRFSRLDSAELSGSALRFRLYAAGKMGRERMMGERLFHLSGLSLDGEMEATLVLEPRSNMKVGSPKRRHCAELAINYRKGYTFLSQTKMLTQLTDGYSNSQMSNLQFVQRKVP